MTSILVTKVMEGLSSQGWEVIGRGGTWVGAMRPLDAYIQGKVERAVKAERKAILNILRDYAGRKDLSDSDESLLKHLFDLIRARGEA